jgi:hypothetical protein
VIEVCKSFEQEASRFAPMVLLVPGLVMVGVGLIAWLAGLWLRRPVLAWAGTAGGGLAAWLLFGPNATIVALAAGGGAVLGAVLPRLFTAVLLTAFSVAVAFVVVTTTRPAEGQRTLSVSQNVGQGQERLAVSDSIKTARVLLFDLVGRVKAAARDLETASWAVVAVPGLVLLVLGLLFPRLAGALTFSALGTALMFAGLIVLLIHKGSGPVGLVQKQGAFYGLVLLGMVVFGTLEQAVLGPSPRRRHQAGAAGAHPRAEESERSWRTR